MGLRPTPTKPSAPSSGISAGEHVFRGRALALPLKYLKQAKSFLASAVAVCLGIRIIWWCLAPLVPYLVTYLVVIWIFAFIFGIAWNRTSKL